MDLQYPRSKTSLYQITALLRSSFLHPEHTLIYSKSVYTPLVLRDWFRAAPRNPLTTSQLLDITPCRLNMMNNGMLLIRSSPASMTFLI